MKDNVYEEEVSPIKILGLLLPSLPTILFRFGGTFLRFKRSAKKAGKIFRKELLKQGLDKQTATELTDLYMRSSQIKYFMQTLR